ncbi:helix-turn-helix domain-containing protein [Streptomyces sp. H39-C1]|uniref:helix-turn-helix domain-containing protein n=1 Tax=Streptomyces sp. H39-C1 TaxID=3004355 RepID=UPI0022AE99D7|nr:helix-turn-helix domain-containing protein [Streptomyces sp. H39-C1]MCZ4103700.1 helix-turn-helix domain-containing protein [Streptomyces sp. H39-C1]
MSVDSREWVWEHSASRGTARLVLLSIADRVPDKQCVAWASLTSLIERTNGSRSAVRAALLALADSGELELLDDYQGPQRVTVYRLPRAAAFQAKIDAAREEDPDAHVEPSDADPVPKLVPEKLQRYGIWPKKGTDSAPSRRNPTGAESDPSRRNPTPRRYGNNTLEGAESDPQNRSEPKVNRRYSSSAGAGVIPAAEWQVDPATHAWARQQGHLDRLGEQGLQAADEKWRLHRADFKPRGAGAWAADWRSWIAREHPPGRPNLYAVSGKSAAAPGGMTRAEAHTAALLAALDEPTGTEG